MARLSLITLQAALRRLLLSVAALAALGSVDAWAQMAQEPVQDAALLHREAERFAADLAQSKAQNIGGVAHVSVGQPDARLRLAACADLQAFQPPGARPVGKTMVGIRCMSGRPWQVFLPADIHIEAPVWVSVQALPAGHVLAPEDLAQRSQEVLVTEGENHTLTATDNPPFGATLARGVAAEAALRASDLHDASRIAAGDSVQVVYDGTGFSVESEGKSVNAAAPGQNVQVRMASGSTVSGVLQQAHIVRVEM
jgi:flagella basal body P-ring formation protein FlgA